MKSGQTTFPAGEGQLTGASGGAAYESTVTINPDTVSFVSGDAVSGKSARSSSTSAVSITFTNDTNGTIAPTLESTIIPAGMGFYLADQSGGCGGDIYTGCAQGLSGAFSQLSRGSSVEAAIQPLATASFDFAIESNGQTLYELHGTMNLVYDRALRQIVVDTLGLADAASRLDGFTLATSPGNQAAVGYAWDSTSIFLDLLSMAPGQSQTLTYRTSVSSFSQAGCIGQTKVCLVAYAGFGDPIGRGGGVESLQAFRSIGALAEGGVQDVEFTPATFNIPTFKDGVLTFKQLSDVPEPSSWALMIFGFGLLGAALRRGRILRYT